MSEGIYQVVQFGRQANVATAVAATTVFPSDAGFMGFELDRAVESPDEDTGSASRERPSRGSYGVRWATASMPFVARFEDLMHVFEAHVGGTSGTPTGTASPYTYTYTFDDTSDTLKPYTVEYGVDGTTNDEWRAYGAYINELELGFDALTTPGNSMWKGTASWVALTREQNALTGSLSAPSTLETLEGHLSTVQEGAAGTAFASLGTATATLKQFTFRSTINAIGRAYGGSSDVAASVGRSGKGEVGFDALLAINSTTKSDIHDIFTESGGLVTDRRWRITVAGSSSKSLNIDFKARLTKVDRGDSNGERLYAVSGVWVYDATLGGRGQFTLKNGVASIP